MSEGGERAEDEGAAPVERPGSPPKPPAWEERPPAGPPAATAPAKESWTQQQVNRNRWGLLLLLVGVLLLWVPLLNVVAGLLVMGGLALVVAGRRLFASPHARNAVAALLLYIAGFAGAVVALVPLGRALGGFAPDVGGEPQLAALADLLLLAFVALAVGSAFAFVLATYALQDLRGRLLLLMGYAAFVGLAVVASFLVLDVFRAAMAGTVTVTEFLATVLPVSLPFLAPAGLFAVAYVMLYLRIRRGDVPGVRVTAVPE